jgi:hypothetical protein
VKLGAEPKKVAIFGVLLVVAGYVMYTNVINPDNGMPPEAKRSATANVGSPGVPSPMAEITQPRTPPSGSSAAGGQAAGAAKATERKAPRRNARGASQEWVPRVGARRPEERPDPTTVDPSLRLDRLEKLKAVTFTGGDRSLFDFSQAPPPKVEAPKIVPTVAMSKPPEPKTTEPTKPAEAVKPPPPPIPLKFYGFVTASDRRAFFLNGEEIFVASEGDLVQKRYKVVRIGVNSAVLEDTEHKHQQTLPLEQAPATS